jgi:hypothetical protein
MWLIDGETVADPVARTTTRSAADYRPGLLAASVLAPDANMFGQPGRLWRHFTGEPEQGIVPLLICSCGIEGCLSLIADVEVTLEQVRSCRIRHATAANHPGVPWDGPSPPDVVFDRGQYEEKVARVTSPDYAVGDDPPVSPAELAFMRARFDQWRAGGPRAF